MSSPSWHPVEDSPAVTLESNWLFDLRREPYRSRRTGQVHDYYVLHLADAVNVVAITPERQLVLVRQFRAGSGQDSLETPGGLVNEGEDVLSAAARELREETGYEGDPPILLGMPWSNPSILSSRIATVLIRNAHPTADVALDHNEEVSVELVHAGRIPHMIRDRRINHALVVQGLLLWLVSEIPDQPLAVGAARTGRHQFHIRSLLAWILATGGIFGILANMGRLASIGLAWIVASAAVLAIRQWDPYARCLLLRGRIFQVHTWLVNALAWFGALVISLGLGLVVLSLL